MGLFEESPQTDIHILFKKSHLFLRCADEQAIFNTRF
jgi:hypothetical protein